MDDWQPDSTNGIKWISNESYIKILGVYFSSNERISNIEKKLDWKNWYYYTSDKNLGKEKPVPDRESSYNQNLPVVTNHIYHASPDSPRWCSENNQYYYIQIPMEKEVLKQEGFWEGTSRCVMQWLWNWWVKDDKCDRLAALIHYQMDQMCLLQ